MEYYHFIIFSSKFTGLIHDKEYIQKTAFNAISSVKEYNSNVTTTIKHHQCAPLFSVMNNIIQPFRTSRSQDTVTSILFPTAWPVKGPRFNITKYNINSLYTMHLRAKISKTFLDE